MTGRWLSLCACAALAALGVFLLQLLGARQPDVIFVVLDTVRTDHTSVCGYAERTTPTLETLRDRGASVACRAYAPGSWTLPTHASFFTGLPVHVHRADFVEVAPETLEPQLCGSFACGESEPGRILAFGSIAARPLSDVHPLLAERFAALGYRTVSVSGNPVLAPLTGLTRGFEEEHHPDTFGPLYGDALVKEVEATLERGDDRPLFLFVNIADAHDPWTAPPGDEGKGIAYFTAEDDPWTAVVTGALGEADEARLLERIEAHYDHGIARADASLGRILGLLEAHGRMDHFRLVVTSDHGEYLGEHGLLQHGVYLYEPNQRVPLLYWDGQGGVALPEPTSALQAHALVLQGTPDEGLEVEATGAPNAYWIRRSGGAVGGVVSAARWHGSTKTLWVDGRTLGYDLASDPGEVAPRPVEGAEAEAVAALARAGREPVEGVEEDLATMLRSLGYAD